MLYLVGNIRDLLAAKHRHAQVVLPEEIKQKILVVGLAAFK